MKRVLLLMLIASHALPVCAQPGRTGIGTRGSLDGFGLTAKYFVDRNFAFEGQLNAGGVRLLNGHSFYFVALIEYHLLLPVTSFRLYFGGGAQAGYWSGRDETPFPDEFMAGLSGIGGLEYLFRRFPISISGDVRLPSITFRKLSLCRTTSSAWPCAITSAPIRRSHLNTQCGCTADLNK